MNPVFLKQCEALASSIFKILVPNIRYSETLRCLMTGYKDPFGAAVKSDEWEALLEGNRHSPLGMRVNGDLAVEVANGGQYDVRVAPLYLSEQNDNAGALPRME